MVNANFFLPDFLEIQRNGFFYLLEKGIIEEIQKRNPITNVEKQIEIFFYPEYYRFTKPLYSIEQALFFKKSYVAKFYVPVQLTDRKKKQIFLKWVLLAHFPLMTNRGHFVLNGSPRVIIHQLVRSPGIYFRENKHEVFSSKWSEKPITTFRRFYADIICSKGTWLRIETEKDFSMWAKMKKGPKIPLLWFLLGMGLSEKYILNSVSKPTNLFESFQKEIQKLKKSNSNKEPKYPYISSPKQAWEQIQKLLKLKKTSNKFVVAASLSEKKKSFFPETKNALASPEGAKDAFALSSIGTASPSPSPSPSFSPSPSPLLRWGMAKLNPKGFGFSVGARAQSALAQPIDGFDFPFPKRDGDGNREGFTDSMHAKISTQALNKEKNFSKKIESFDLGRKWFFNKFMNPQMYDLGKQGRLSINKKLGLTISSDQTTLTALDLLLLTDYLMKMQDGIFEVDDIDHLKNKRVRSSGECLQEIFSIGFLRLEKSIRLKLNYSQSIGQKFNSSLMSKAEKSTSGVDRQSREAEGRGWVEGLGQDDLGRVHTDQNQPKPPAKDPRQSGGEAAPQLGFATPKGGTASLGMRSIPAPLGEGKAFPQRGSRVDEFYDVLTESKSPSLAQLSGALKDSSQSNLGLHQLCQNEGLVKPMQGLTPFGGREGSLARDGEAAQRGWGQKPLAQGKDLVKVRGQNPLTQTYTSHSPKQNSNFILQSLLNTRPINGAFREFFGTHPLSQFMDQINPLAEITHKRRLTSLGPGGVSRDTATLAIRGIHPSHYGRICPIETPEGKNTGLVNSLTTYAKLSSSGMLKSPFYKIFKGQIQKNLGVFFLDPEQEEHFKIATPDLNFTDLGFLPKNSVPVRTGKRFARMKPNKFALIGVSPLQMISVATSFIPFLEHDDANRALMGSNMQRQAVPLLKPERPFLGTGFEAKVIRDSGHAVFAKKSGYVMYSSGSSILIYVF